jgi:hypothetical protein
MGELAQYQYTDNCSYKKCLPWLMKGPVEFEALEAAKVWGLVEKKLQEEVKIIDPYNPIYGLAFRVVRSPVQVPIPIESLADKFDSLATQWKKETMHLSSVTDKAIHPCYQRIIGLGPDVIPLILQRLRKNDGHWYWALQSITGENPVRPEHHGDINNMKNDWIMWGVHKGYIK